MVLPGAWLSVDLLTSLPSTFLQHYDVHLCLYGKNGAIYSEWEALINFLLQLQALDNTIQVLPWYTSTHQQHNLPIAISSIPQAFLIYRLMPHDWLVNSQLDNMSGIMLHATPLPFSK